MKKIRYIGIVLLALFASKLVGDLLLTHTHTYEWGEVTHSHPYSQKGHSHSADELIAIAQLSNTTYTTSERPELQQVEQSEISINWYYTESTFHPTLSHISLRAPPSLR